MHDVCAANRSAVTFKLNKADKTVSSCDQIFAYVSTLLTHTKAKNLGDRSYGVRSIVHPLTAFMWVSRSG